MSDQYLPPPPPPPPPGQPPGGYQQYGYGYGYGPTSTYSGFWRRVGAVIIDGFVIGIPANILFAIMGLDPIAAFVPRLALTAVYYAILEGGPKGQTVGKMACSIRVVDETSGQPGIGPGRAIGRYFASYLSLFAIFLGYLWMLWDPRKQTWHDKLVRTLVVRSS